MTVCEGSQMVEADDTEDNFNGLEALRPISNVIYHRTLGYCRV